MITEPASAQHPSESEDHHVVRPQSSSSHCLASTSDHPKPHGETLRPKAAPSPAVHPDKTRGPSEGSISRRSSSLLSSLRPPLSLQAKEGLHSVNGRTKPWDSFTPEEFAQQFHESVLQSTQKALQKNKGEGRFQVLLRSSTLADAVAWVTFAILCQYKKKHLFMIENCQNQVEKNMQLFLVYLNFYTEAKT